MTTPEITKLAASYAGAHPLPTPPRWSWCRNPDTSEYCERLLDPFAVAAAMTAAGLPARVRHGFRKFPLNLLNNSGMRWLNERLFQLRSFFVVVGVKP